MLRPSSVLPRGFTAALHYFEERFENAPEREDGPWSPGDEVQFADETDF